MQRCLQLAAQGAGYVAPNPMVGAILVHEGRIIGEGWHRQYGEAHAEVNCINSVKEADRHLLPSATLYVSLEPCNHFGKTPPCTNLVIKERIPKVVIACRDSFQKVNGAGMATLAAAGIEVITGVLEKEARFQNRRFFTFHEQQRPYIILKWAQTADGKIAGTDSSSRLLISNEHTNLLVHRWRSEEAAILVGTNTAMTDNPRLTNRYWPGKSPVRLVIDRELKLPAGLHLFDQSQRTIVFNALKDEKLSNLEYVRITGDGLKPMLGGCYEAGLQSILVEGGAKLIQSFFEAGLWDEARVITNRNLYVADGLDAPVTNLPEAAETITLENDTINIYFANH